MKKNLAFVKPRIFAACGILTILSLGVGVYYWRNHEAKPTGTNKVPEFYTSGSPGIMQDSLNAAVDTRNVQDSKGNETQKSRSKELPRKNPNAQENPANLELEAFESLSFDELLEKFTNETNNVAKIPIVEYWVRTNESKAISHLLATLKSKDPYLRGAVINALGQLGRRINNTSIKQKIFIALFDLLRVAAQEPRPQALADALIACDALAQLGFAGENDRTFAELGRLDTLQPDLAFKLLILARALARNDLGLLQKSIQAQLEGQNNRAFRELEPEMKRALKEETEK